MQAPRRLMCLLGAFSYILLYVLSCLIEINPDLHDLVDWFCCRSCQETRICAAVILAFWMLNFSVLHMACSTADLDEDTHPRYCFLCHRSRICTS